jgi:head-tail adaptor
VRTPEEWPALRRKLVLEAPGAVADGLGGVATSWTVVGTLWAEVASVSGREIFEGARLHGRVTHRVSLRGAPEGSPRRPRPDQRFRDGVRVYDILAVAEGDPMGRYLVCWVEEGRGS